MTALLVLGMLAVILGLMMPPRGYRMRPTTPLLLALGTLLIAVSLAVGGTPW